MPDIQTMIKNRKRHFKTIDGYLACAARVIQESKFTADGTRDDENGQWCAFINVLLHQYDIHGLYPGADYRTQLRDSIEREDGALKKTILEGIERWFLHRRRIERVRETGALPPPSEWKAIARNGGAI